MSGQAVVVQAGSVTALNVIGDMITPLVTGAQTAGGIEIFDLTGPQHSGPPPHDHPWDEAYLVLDGQVEVLLGERVVVLRSGDAANIPGGTIHSYRILTPSARFIVVTSPAGAAEFFADMDANVHQMPQDAGRLMEVAARNRVSVHVPAPA
jgi:quercetin dioxygenase-like cupin family protein